MPLLGRPVKSIGRACGSATIRSKSSGPTLTIRSDPIMPQHMCPRTRNASPPNIFRSTTSDRGAIRFRIRPASGSSNGISDDLRTLRWLRLRHSLVEPDLVSVRVHDLEGLVAPPLGGEPLGDLDAILLQTRVVRVDVCDLEVDRDGLFLHACVRCGARVLGTCEHQPGAAHHDADKVELAILAEYPHDMVETQGLDVEVARLVYGFDVDDWHDLLRCGLLVHLFLLSRDSSRSPAQCHAAVMTFNYSW